MTKNRLMVTIHSKDVTEILALYRRSEIDFPVPTAFSGPSDAELSNDV